MIRTRTHQSGQGSPNPRGTPNRAAAPAGFIDPQAIAQAAAAAAARRRAQSMEQ
jgi:hypothetical protein